MRVRIIQRHGYGDRHGVHHKCGAVIDVTDATAVKLLAHRIAEPAPALVIETAAKAAPENAAKAAPKPKTKASKSSRPAKEEAE